jgi:cysteine desulfuration protein SufE
MNKTPDSQLPTLPELLAEFAELHDWEERYDYLIDLGKTLPDHDESFYLPANRVHGCMSTVWMVVDPALEGDGVKALRIRADSDSLIVNGLIVVLLAIFDGKSPAAILAADEAAIFRQLGLDQNLSPQRRNGLYAMVQRVRQAAVEAAASGHMARDSRPGPP